MGAYAFVCWLAEPIRPFVDRRGYAHLPESTRLILLRLRAPALPLIRLET